ncbi:MAG: hypothetical protein EA425_17240, partial [Puniceicoccaceae bacterium]
PPPEPPPTRKVELTYQGFFENSRGERVAWILKDGELGLVAVEQEVAEGWMLTEVRPEGIVLRQDEEHQLELRFNQRTEVAVPQ